MVIFIFLVNIFALYNLCRCFAPLSLLWGEIFRNKQHHIGVKEKMEGLFSLFSPMFLDALQAEYTPFAIFFPFLSVKVKALWDCECDGPQGTAL